MGADLHLHRKIEQRFFVDNLMIGVQLADVSTRRSFALRMTRASSWNVGKLYTDHQVVHRESLFFLSTATATENDVTIHLRTCTVEFTRTYGLCVYMWNCTFSSVTLSISSLFLAFWARNGPWLWMSVYASENVYSMTSTPCYYCVLVFRYALKLLKLVYVCMTYCVHVFHQSMYHV